ncbi:MAG: lysophospholipid acyltransferase family protein [Limisphaerales bacterium]
MSEWLLILLVRLALPVLQSIPLPWVARIGRAGGAAAWIIDRRHRRVALANLERCFGERMNAAERRTLARENFLRLGENYASALRTSTMTWDQIAPHVDLTGLQEAKAVLDRNPDRSVVVAIGHFGNFELFTWVKVAFPGVQLATTYRALRQESANRMLLALRQRSGCLFFERRREAAALRRAMSARRTVVGLLADQADTRGVRVPFLGSDAWTSTAPAVLALRYDCVLLTGCCFRVGPAQWRLEMGDEIPTRTPDGRRRKPAEIATDMNRSFERAVHRDPANWFWVHRRWKPGPSKLPDPSGVPLPIRT